MQFGPADVKNCVFVHSCVEHVTFLADENVLVSEKDCYTDMFKCWSDASSLFNLTVGRTSSASQSSD